MKVSKTTIAKLTFLSLIFFGVMAVGSVSASGPGAKQNLKASSKANSARRYVKPSAKAKITMEAAREIALKRASGTVESGVLEKKRGKFVYAFDIRNDKGTVTDVWVNARSGKVVRKAVENAKTEAKVMKKKGKH